MRVSVAFGFGAHGGSAPVGGLPQPGDKSVDAGGRVGDPLGRTPPGVPDCTRHPQPTATVQHVVHMRSHRALAVAVISNPNVTWVDAREPVLLTPISTASTAPTTSTKDVRG